MGLDFLSSSDAFGQYTYKLLHCRIIMPAPRQLPHRRLAYRGLLITLSAPLEPGQGLGIIMPAPRQLLHCRLAYRGLLITLSARPEPGRGFGVLTPNRCHQYNCTGTNSLDFFDLFPLPSVVVVVQIEAGEH